MNEVYTHIPQFIWVLVVTVIFYWILKIHSDFNVSVITKDRCSDAEKKRRLSFGNLEMLKLTGCVALLSWPPVIWNMGFWIIAYAIMFLILCGMVFLMFAGIFDSYAKVPEMNVEKVVVDM